MDLSLRTLEDAVEAVKLAIVELDSPLFNHLFDRLHLLSDYDCELDRVAIEQASHFLCSEGMLYLPLRAFDDVESLPATKELREECLRQNKTYWSTMVMNRMVRLIIDDTDFFPSVRNRRSKAIRRRIQKACSISY